MAFSGKHLMRAAAAIVSVAALALSAACGSGNGSGSASASSDSSDITQQTVTPGKLTIATGDPAYEPWVMNDKPESGEGYEAAVAYAVAEKMADRYDNDFKDSDYLESTYDVDDNLNSEEEKTSILEQIKSYQSETRDSDVKENK